MRCFFLKKVISILLVTVILLAGCTAKTDNKQQIGENGFKACKITDSLGRTVEITSEPQRIVSGYYISTSILIALGQKDKIVGIEDKAESRPIYTLVDPKLIELPGVGTAKQFDLEGTAALKPDLVILPQKLKDVAGALDELGIRTIFVNPEGMPGLIDSINMIARACGADERGADLVDTINTIKNTKLQDLLKEQPKTRVYLAGNSSYLKTAGSKMYQNSMITIAGGENVAADITDDYWAEISYEQLLAYNPEVIIIASDAQYSVEDVMKDENLQQLDAVKNGKVYAMPSVAEAWDSPVPATVFGSWWTALRLHGDVLDENEYYSGVADFYAWFYGFDVNRAGIAEALK